MFPKGQVTLEGNLGFVQDEIGQLYKIILSRKATVALENKICQQAVFLFSANKKMDRVMKLRLIPRFCCLLATSQNSWLKGLDKEFLDHL